VLEVDKETCDQTRLLVAAMTNNDRFGPPEQASRDSFPGCLKDKPSNIRCPLNSRRTILSTPWCKHVALEHLKAKNRDHPLLFGSDLDIFGANVFSQEYVAIHDSPKSFEVPLEAN